MYIIITCFIKHKMRLVSFKFQSITLQISVNDFFIVLEESQDELGIPKAIKFERHNSHLMFNETCYNNLMLPTYTNIRFPRDGCPCF